MKFIWEVDRSTGERRMIKIPLEIRIEIEIEKNEDLYFERDDTRWLTKSLLQEAGFNI